MRALNLAVIISLMGTAACSKAKQEPATDSQAGTAMDSGSMPGMSGMGGAGMMPMMQAHMDSMMRMSPAQMSGMRARHERMLSEMMDRMGREMRQMNMSASSGWTALTDSIKLDLAELPGLSGEKLQTRMRAHGERVQRLMAEHQKMMKGM